MWGLCVPHERHAGRWLDMHQGRQWVTQLCMMADLQVHSLAPPRADACRLGDRGLHLLGAAVVEDNLGVLQAGQARAVSCQP